MKKLLPLALGIILIIILVIVLRPKGTRVVDWEETFNERSTAPYGLSVLYKEFPNLFKDRQIRTVYHTPSSYLFANSENGYGDHAAKGSYVIIGNSDYLYDASIKQLLSFVEEGNTLFISDYTYPKTLTDTLNLTIAYAKNETDSISNLSFKTDALQHKNTIIDKNGNDFFFENLDSPYAEVLGYVENDGQHPNFIQIPIGEGNVYLHLEPKVFANYNVLKDDRHKYVEGALSYLPDDDIYYDSYTKFSTSYGGNVEEDSELGWFLEQLSFKWAWFTGLILALLFVIFNAKRRQRIIKIIKPLQNTTVAFVKTISNLYFETKDHKNLIDKKITYFLEKIRTSYNLDTSALNEEFIAKLSSKSGKKVQQVKGLIRYINQLRSKDEFYENDLIQLNKHIEAFYSK